MGDVIAKGKVVDLAYILRDEDGDILDDSTEGGPLRYLHGHENIVPGLEKALDDKAVGDKLRVTVLAEEGFGEFDEEGVQVVTRDMFPDDARVEVGAEFLAEDEDGEDLPFWVAAVEGDEVTIDFNHPLAGQALDFEVEVLAIRDATAEEKAHGHAHDDDDDDDEAVDPS